MFDNIRYMQYLSAFTATTGVMSGTIYMNWPSPILDDLISENSPIGVTMTDEEASWMVSVLLLAALPAPPFVALLLWKIGRKRTLQISGLFLFFPWFLIIFANDKWYLFLARLIAGFGIPMITASCSIYNGEIADTDIRGKLGTFINLMKIVGSLIVLSVGPFVSYTVISSICAAIPIVFLSTFSFMPESPYHLMKIGKPDDAKKALYRLAAKNVEESQIEKRMLEIETTLKKDEESVGFVEFLTKKQHRKIILLMLGLKMVQQMSGAAAIDSYMQDIIASSESSLEPKYSSIIFGAVQIPASILAFLIVDKLGRKPMLVISAFGCAVALISEGVYFYLQDYLHSEDIQSLGWLPVTALVLFLLMSNFGILNLPFVLLGEMFADNVKGVAVSLASCLGAFFGFIVSKIFNPVKQAFGMYTIFWIYAGFCVAGGIFVLLALPETKGKTFDEIQDQFNNIKIKKVEEKNGDEKV
ncbi:PREDICTED: facilitated trehalose transporter Tret1-like [Nicrophorus vespilloides]|uniref:Facilitated trehalose transporter Tret1-like n=1 Tax=Nicrophorus vespilloides TaxID=110193 RepID=A0ABM1N747_NICVS|nr:PREDICTED: facilitated trehalose transporter Tret1-like [Nicrophorus vespilloides]